MARTTSKALDSFFVVPGYTFFYWGFTLPQKDLASFKKHFGFKKGALSKEITLVIAGKPYKAKIRLARITSRGYEVAQVFYDREYATLKALRKLFIYSYATTIRKSRPKLKELMELKHMGGTKFKVNPIARQETDFDEMLQFMEEKNLFGYWQETKRGKKDRFFVDFSRKWIPAAKLKEYRERINVIYFLYSEKHKHLYVGKANKLGSRVKEGEGRIGLLDWDKFMFFEIDPMYTHALEEIEAYTIRTFASILDNDVKMIPLDNKVNKLVNRQLRTK